MEDNCRKFGQICFWIGIVIEVITVIVDKSAYINPYEGIIFRLTFLLFLIKVITTRYSLKEWICIGAVGLIALISYFINGKDEVVRAVILIAACKDISMEKLLKTVLGITLIGSVLLFALSVTGVYGALSVTANFGRGEFPGIIETRYCFGMGHPNAFQCMLFMMSSLVIYLFCKRMQILHFIILWGLNFIAFLYTDSNTAFLMLTAMIIGVVLLKYCKLLRESKTIYILAAAFLIFLVLFSAYGSHTGRGVDEDLIFKIDRLLNGRFQYSHIIENARVENWKLFAIASNEEYFDQGYIRLFYWYGIIPGIVYILGNLYLIYQSYKNKDYALVVIITAYAVFSIMEAHLISYYLLRNYLLIWFGYYWYQPFAERQETEGYFWQVPKLLLNRE